MSSPEKNPEECLHITIWRLPPEKKGAVLEFNGKGFLKPVLMCNDCGSILYIVSKGGKREKKTEG